MTSLEQYGWENFFQPTQLQNDLIIGRVISIQGFKYFVITAAGEREAELSGRLLHGANAEELPKLGDWVTLKDYDTLGYIIDVLPRRNALSRRVAGTRTDRQVLAANIDAALIVQGLDRDFNTMRLERYLVQLAACHIAPIVVLNKADLVTDWDAYAREINRLQRDCPVYFCSTYTRVGLDTLLNSVLEKNKTYLLIGSSGVGKSSLLNALMHADVQAVNSTSDFNSKGRHTTTSRELFQLPNGSLLIDTPGMREFGVTAEAGSTDDDMFPAIQPFAVNCRYADCRHLLEAGCAVIAAVQSGELESKVYQSYLKLVKEQRRFEMNAEEKKRANKQFGKLTKEAKAHRNKYKY